MVRTPEDVHAIARDLANRGRYASAKRLLSSAVQTAADHDVRARIRGTLAYALAQTGELDAAEAMCLEALAEPGITPTTAALVAGQMGALEQRRGHLDDAARWLARGIDGLGEDSTARANMLMNSCLVNIGRQKLDAAAADARHAERIYAGEGSTVDAAKARHNLGYIDLLRGDLVVALQEMQSARAILSAQSPVTEAIGDVDRAEVLRDAGLTTEAERILSQTAATFGRHRMPQSRAEAEFNLARSQLTHDPVRARRTAAQAASRFRALGNETWVARAEGVRLRADLSGGAVREGGGRIPDPRRPPDGAAVAAAAVALDRLGLRSEAAGLRTMWELWRARHGLAPGRRAIRIPASASMEVRLLAHEARAVRSAAAGRAAQARVHASAGLDALGRWQESFGSLDLQTSIVMHARGLMLAGLASAVASRRPEVVFEWSERARHLSQQVVPLRPPPDPQLAAELAELRMLRADGPGWLNDPRTLALRERARERQWSGTGSARVQQRVTLDALRAALTADTALLAYVFSGDALTALVVTRERARLIDLPEAVAARSTLPGLRADLDMAATITGPMATVVQRSLDDRLAEISSAILTEPLRVAGTRRVVITTPGVLATIPWAMLPAMRGHVFTLATSATRWASTRCPAAAARSAGFAVGPRVPRGEEEADAAASAWATSTVLRAGEATVDAVTALASEVDVLHIAAHGRHAADNPMFSGLELVDGALFGYDVDLMPRVPDAVVLSACEVGRSSVRWGEEAIGMARVWLHAGTRCVVATPVIVADDVACELLGAMHAGLATGMAPAEALAAASERSGIVAPFQVHGSGF